MTIVEHGFNSIRHHNIWDIGLRDVLGNNIARTITSRRLPADMFNYSLMQLGNSGLFYGGGWALNQLLDKIFNILPKTNANRQWTTIGKSLSIYSLLGFISLAFWEVATQFSINPKHQSIRQESGNKRTLFKAKQLIQKGISVCLLTILSTIGLTFVNAPVPAWVPRFSKQWLLKNGQFSQMPDLGYLICQPAFWYFNAILALE